METNPRVWIAAWRSGHDRLAAFVNGASADDLNHPSMCAEWNVAQVLSHLGSGAEIGLANVTGAAVDHNDVWAQWNAMAPAEMAASFVTSDERFLTSYESRSDTELASMQVHMPFLPEPIGAAEAVGWRLSEVTLHGWDVFAAFDADAPLAPDAAELLIDRLPTMVGLVGRFLPRETRPVTDTTISVITIDPERQYELELSENAELRQAAERATSGQLTLPAEAFLRLTAGRLGPGREAGARASGALSLDDLRRAFPGY